MVAVTILKLALYTVWPSVLWDLCFVGYFRPYVRHLGKGSFERLAIFHRTLEKLSARQNVISYTQSKTDLTDMLFCKEADHKQTTCWMNWWYKLWCVIDFGMFWYIELEWFDWTKNVANILVLLHEQTRGKHPPYQTKKPWPHVPLKQDNYRSRTLSFVSTSKMDMHCSMHVGFNAMWQIISALIMAVIITVKYLQVKIYTHICDTYFTTDDDDDPSGWWYRGQIFLLSACSIDRCCFQMAVTTHNWQATKVVPLSPWSQLCNMMVNVPEKVVGANMPLGFVVKCWSTLI